MVGTDGEPGASTFSEMLFAAPVFKLNKLGFRLPFNVGGLIKDGDAGSEPCKLSTLEFKFNARLFGFLAFRGDGDVIGRSSLKGNRKGFVSAILRVEKESRAPKVVPEKEDNGTSVIGDSGDELGDGSDKEEESMVDIVVVGDESVESEAWVEVLSRC